MWKAVRKIFVQDEAPEEAPAPRDETTAQRAPAPGGQGGESPGGAAPPGATAPTPDAASSLAAKLAVEEAPAAPNAPSATSATGATDGMGATGTTVTMGAEVSPPGHAPQGLAAEPDTPSTPPVPGVPAPATAPAGRPDTEAQAGPAETVDAAATAPPHVSAPAGGATGEVPGAPAPSVQAPAQIDQPDHATAGAAPVSAEPPAAPLPASHEASAPESSGPIQGAPAATAAPAAPQAATTPPPPQSAAEVTPEPAQPAAAEMLAPEPALEPPAAPAAIEPPGPEAPVAEEAARAAATAAAPTPPAGAAASEAPVAEVEAADAAPPAAEPAPQAAPGADEAAPAGPLTPLAPGTVVGGRYTITGLIEGAETDEGTLAYHASDAQSYARCWSCGSTANGPSTRFCQNCGAPIQDHPVTLIQTREATGEPGEVAQEGTHFHVEPERRLFGAEGVGIEIGAHSAEGPHHPNEDSYWYVTRTLCANSKRQSLAVIVFADGMGGYAPGSGLISARIAEITGTAILGGLDGRDGAQETLDEAEAEAIMREAIAAANEMVLAEIARKGEMGATLVAVMVYGETAYVGNVGDSRAYYVDPHGRAAAITHDQSLVAQEVQQGHLAESDIYTALGNNIILHAIGEPGVEDAADWYSQPLEPGSYLLLCSDGYWKTLHGAVVPDDVRAESASLSEMARRMVDDALAQGSDDNTTVVLIAIS